MGNSNSSRNTGGGGPGKTKLGRGLMDPEKVNGLSYLEDGQFAKVYKGHMATGPSQVRSLTQFCSVDFS